MARIRIWKINIILILLIILTAFRCNDQNKINEPGKARILNDMSCKKVILYDPEIKLSSDPFEFVEISIEGACLKITAAYGGGCENDFFQLHEASGIMESHPAQMNLFLKLEDNDHCEAYVHTDLFFDLQSISLPYNTGTIRFHLKDYPAEIVYTY
ncbi:MAG: hypothetical protein M3512_09680 [Bacteroidota bacterium]|nr:hypothetical protein [Bacteroidota bacterium]